MAVCDHSLTDFTNDSKKEILFLLLALLFSNFFVYEPNHYKGLIVKVKVYSKKSERETIFVQCTTKDQHVYESLFLK